MGTTAAILSSSLTVLAIGAIFAVREDRKNKKLRRRMAEQQQEALNAKRAPSQNG